jgi:hypothetical protein
LPSSRKQTNTRGASKGPAGGPTPLLHKIPKINGNALITL